MSADSGPRARPDVVFRALSHEWVLYDPRSRELHVLNLTAALVWTLCDGSLDAAGMARSIVETVAESPPESEVVQDVQAVLDTFRSEGLLE